MRHGCGTVVDADEILCPGCGGAVTEETLSPLEEAATTVLPAGAAAPPPAVGPSEGERLCPTEWCRRPLLPGATVCDGCHRPVPPATPQPGPGPSVPAPTGRPALATATYALVLPGAVRLVLRAGETLELGREAGPAVVRATLAPLDTVSRRHASVTAAPDGAVVRDLNSANGTFVDDVAVSAAITVRPPVVLRLGQTVRIGLVEGEGS
ncbi:MAG: FHA domain-containing protein [Actinobacteria bacterium]|nr:FHA domain-containing protein [Actinomycetota bacterium]